MTPAAPTPADVLEKVDALGPPGTPVTTPEVAEGFDCTQRTIYNRLVSLVDDETLNTKKVGANSRVWWSPECQSKETKRERTLKETKERYQDLLTSIDEGFCIIEKVGLNYTYEMLATTRSRIRLTDQYRGSAYHTTESCSCRT